MPPTRANPGSRRAAQRTDGPTEVVPGIYVGGWKESLGFVGTRFCVLDEAPEGFPPARHFPVYDSRADSANLVNLEQLADAIAAARANGEPVLVFCGHGVRRSPLGVAWYLHRVEKLTLDEAYDRLRAVRPWIERGRDWIGHPENLDEEV